LVVLVGLARASRERAHIQELLTQRLERADLTPGVMGLLLLARETTPWPGGQGDLFEPRTPGDDEALGCLVDRLAGRLGHEAIVRPRLVDDYRPAASQRLRQKRSAVRRPFTPRTGRRSVAVGASPRMAQARNPSPSGALVVFFAQLPAPRWGSDAPAHGNRGLRPRLLTDAPSGAGPLRTLSGACLFPAPNIAGLFCFPNTGCAVYRSGRYD
jgi:hypothetical protein